MATVAELMEALKRADAAGDTAAATAIAKAIQAQSQQEQQGPQDFGLGNAVRHGLQQGATFGFADEASAAGRAALDPLMDFFTGSDANAGDTTFSERYKMYRDSEREQIAGGREHHGGAMMAAEFLPGLLAGGAGVAKSAAGGIRASLGKAAEQSLRSQLPKLAAIGAGYGGVAGAGYSEADTLGGVASDALTGAGFGAGIGTGLPLAGAGIKRGVQNIGRRLGAGGGGVEAAAKEAARRQIIKDLQRDGLTPDQAATVLARNDDFILGDLGRNLGESVEDVMQNPGTKRLRLEDALTNRQMRASDRIIPGLRQGVENNPRTSEGLVIPGTYSEVEKSISKQARDLAKPLWKTAYPPNDQFRATTWMKNLLRSDEDGRILNPQIRKADARAREMLQNRVLTGEIEQQEARHASRYFDELQRALRDQAKATGAKAMGQQATSRASVHRKLIDEMEKVMPKDWQTARKLWAGKKAAEEALKAGEKIFTGNIGKHQSALAKMSVGERDNYLIGALRAIEDRIMKKTDTGDLLRELRATKRGREVVRLLFGGEKGLQRFLNSAQVEETMANTYRRMERGSATYGRGVKGQDVGGAYGTLAGIMIGTNMGIPGAPLLFRFAGRKAADVLRRSDELKRDAMAELLLTRNPQQLTQSLTRPALPMPTAQAGAGLAAATQIPGLLE